MKTREILAKLVKDRVNRHGFARLTILGEPANIRPHGAKFTIQGFPGTHSLEDVVEILANDRAANMAQADKTS